MSSSTLRRASLTLLLLAAGCRHSAPPTLDSIATAYVTLAQALGERDPDALDFSTAPPPTPPTRTLPQITADVNGLLTQLQTLPPQPRANFLRLQLIAIATRATLLQGHTLSFESEAELLFNTHRLADTHATHRTQLRAQIAALLPPIHGTLADRYAAYESHFIIAPTRLEPVLNAAVADCRRRTLEHIALPPNESVTLAFVTHKPWIAFSHYLGHAHSVIEINLDQPLTVDDALELACHEGYPGHHVFNTLRDQQSVNEAHIQPTFSPQSYLSESAAAYAPRLAFSTPERTAIERDILFPIAGLPTRDVVRYVQITALVRDLDSATPAIAAQYLDGHLEFARAEQQLAAESLMANAAPTLLYLNEYRSYMLAYTDGPRRIAAYLAGSNSPWQAYEQIIRNIYFQLPSSG